MHEYWYAFSDLQAKMKSVSRNFLPITGAASYLRLRGSGRSDRGRLEIYRSGYGWLTVCDHFWDMNEAKVICRELGFTGATAVRANSYYGAGTGNILDNHPNCKGTETSFKNCPISSLKSFWTTSGCQGHHREVGIDCN